MRGSASRTAQGVAVVRSSFTDRPHSAGGDPDAQRRLCRGMRAGRATQLREHLHARTTFFDARVLDALARGIAQVVIAGAGYDDRALRFRSPGVRFFELDHPGTQTDKRRRVEALGEDTSGLVFVAADFARHSVAELLGAAGHDASRPTLFICEGLLVYLETREIVELLGALAERAAAGSELAASFAVHDDGLPSAAVVQIANARRGRRAAREPWRTILPAAAHLSLLHAAGWEEHEVVDDAEMRPDARPRRSLLVRASLRVAG
jgi:methyltransferase (TIGR00027 family)